MQEKKIKKKKIEPKNEFIIYCILKRVNLYINDKARKKICRQNLKKKNCSCLANNSLESPLTLLPTFYLFLLQFYKSYNTQLVISKLFVRIQYLQKVFSQAFSTDISKQNCSNVCKWFVFAFDGFSLIF